MDLTEFEKLIRDIILNHEIEQLFMNYCNIKESVMNNH